MTPSPLATEVTFTATDRGCFERLMESLPKWLFFSCVYHWERFHVMTTWHAGVDSPTEIGYFWSGWRSWKGVLCDWVKVYHNNNEKKNFWTKYEHLILYHWHNKIIKDGKYEK